MKRYCRLFKRKYGVRRFFAGALLLIAFIETASHANVGSHQQAGKDGKAFSDMWHNGHTAADCPFHQKHPGRDSSLKDEITNHVTIAGELTVPLRGALRDEPPIFLGNVHTLSRPFSPPFRPPKQV
jgi:hypothetical protein